MASVVAENWEYIESLPQEDFESLELSHANQGLLMSLLDETQVDDCDDDDEERLSKVIQSLEAEIGHCGSHGSADWKDESSGQDWSISPQDLDDHNKWMDDVDFVPSSPSGDWSLENSHEQWPIASSSGTVLDDQWPDDETHFVSSVVNDI